MVEKLSMESKNILSENIEKVAELFPGCLVETEEGKKIDFDILKQELSNDIVEGNRERYHLDFPGKREAIVEANRKTTKTLRPLKDKSVDFDNTKNIYIEGDNLEALKILQESYLGKIKCIYIDPPYNTGNDFVYNDKFSHTTVEELKASGRMDEDGNILISKDINNDSNGRYHSDWLKMMYPRLKLARNLLSDDGVIFISIDDNEQDNLKKICNEIFGEKNFVTDFIRKGSGGRQDSKHYAIIHEYIVCFSKNIEKYISGKIIKNNEEYNCYDEKIKLFYKRQLLRKWGENSKRSDRPNLFYPIIDPDGNENFPMLSDVEEGCWRWGKDTMSENIKKGLVEFKKVNNKWVAYEKIYEKINGEYNTKLYNTIIDDISNSTGASLIKEIFGDKVFDYPKPVDFVQKVLNIGNIQKSDIVLDFFSGSATTAHVVMKLNAEDGGNRQFILVQLPEATDEDSEAYKAGYKTICDIGEERIRRAGKKIKEENPLITKDLDIGFRVYKVDDSNMKDIYYTPDKIDQQNILDMVSNVKEDRNVLDLLTQVMLNLGLPLDLQIEEKKIGKDKLFFVEKNSLVACFDDKVDISILDEISKVSPLKICLKESSFTKDQDKINFFERLKKLSPDTEATII